MCVKQKACLSFVIWFQAVSTVLFFYGPLPYIVEEADSKGVSVAAAGVIASCYNYAALFLGFCVGPITVRFGRKRLLVFGILVECVATTLFGLCQYLSSSTLFFTCAFITRFIAGIGGFFHKTLVFALSSKYLFSHLQVMVMLVMYGITGGISLALFFGNFLYKINGYNILAPSLTFVAISLVLFLPLAIKYIPDDRAEEIKEENQLKAKTQAESDSVRQQDSKRELNERTKPSSFKRALSIVRISFPLKKLICDCKVITFYFALFTFTFTQHFYIAYLNTSLKQNYTLTQLQESLIQSVRPIGALLTCWSTPFIRKKLSRKMIIFIIFSFQSIAMLLLGPSLILRFPKFLALTVSGLFLKGLCDGISYSLLLPEIINILKIKYEGVYDAGRIGDTASGFLQFTQEFTMLLSHQVGPILSAQLTLSGAADVAAAISFVQVGFIFCTGGMLEEMITRKKKGTKKVTNK